MGNELTNAAIRDAVAEASETGKTLHIEGYENSKGAEYNYTLKVPKNGHEFYLSLVSDCVRALSEGKIEKPTDVEPEVWKEACTAQLLSWSKTLNGDQEKRASHEKISVRDGVAVRADGVVILTNCEIVDIQCTTKAESAVNSRPLTLAKKKLASLSPLSKLSPRLNLSPDKVRNVWVDET